eukprot:m.184238 g.184238  ORF g.184238 m.184238 type:complete len:101 (-) comp15008_c0_seq1:769-1071(-)
MSGPWGHLGQAVADVFDIAAPRTTEELEALVNRLFTSQNFRFEATPQSVIDALDEHRLTPGELADNVSCTICLIDFKDVRFCAAAARCSFCPRLTLLSRL